MGKRWWWDGPWLLLIPMGIIGWFFLGDSIHKYDSFIIADGSNRCGIYIKREHNFGWNAESQHVMRSKNGYGKDIYFSVPTSTALLKVKKCL